MTTIAACGSCGVRLREHARFCDECGTPTGPRTETAEYKQVTVLFADVVRSMDIAANLDIERLRDVMTDVVERSAAVVRRYGGTPEYNGDGVMGLFGAPIALEDHAFRGCLAALAIQEEAKRLAAEVARRDGLTLEVRVGLNSGRVIAGRIGSGSLGYGAIGEPVGFAQRMESAATPGGVVLSESTARFVEHRAVLAAPEWLRVKGFAEPVRVHRLVAISPRGGLADRPEADLVGRRWEMAAVDAMVDRAIGGRGGVVNVVGPPGIGKSRLAREVAALAAARGVEVVWAFCESHAVDISFGVVARMLRAALGLADLANAVARAQLRQQFSGADPQDLLLLDDLLGTAHPEAQLPQISPDARRRRLTALVNAATLSRTRPTLYVIEDAHWIDAVSESMLGDFLTVIPRTPSMVLITSRPEYPGALTRVSSGQTIALAPLGDADAAALIAALLGSDDSVEELGAIIADRTAGNPFFAEEMVRELAQRGVLTGGQGNYRCHTDVAEVSVPATVQAAIEARIDRLSVEAKRTLTAASVIGARFDASLLTALGIDPRIDELLSAELIDQVRFAPSVEYAFRHPLIRTVAYESQLKSNRAEWHGRLAEAIQQRDPASVEDNASLIAEHMEAADEQLAAYGWHMRAAAWARNRDIVAARVSWDRACRLADALPAEVADHLTMRIAPRTMLCATDFHGKAFEESLGRFSELRDLCTEAGDKVSLAVGMTGLATELINTGRSREGSRLVTEQMALLASIGDPGLTIGLAFMAYANWFARAEFGQILQLAQTAVDLADGDTAKGAGFGVACPLAISVAFRGLARWWLGHAGWHADLDDAVSMARRSDPATLGIVVAWTYALASVYGVLRADDAALQTIEEALKNAKQSSSDTGLIFAEYALGAILLQRETAADRVRGLDIMAQARQWQLERMPAMLSVTDLGEAREQARRGDVDGAIAVMRDAAADLQQNRIAYAVWGTGVLVEALLERGADADLAEAEHAIGWLVDLQVEQRSAIVDITLLRLRTLMARARDNDATYRDLVTCYRTTARSLGYEGHIAWAQEMGP